MSPLLQDSPLQIAAPLRLFADFLQALADPDAGGRLYSIHASCAPLRHGDGIRNASDVDPAGFAIAHKEISVRGDRLLPHYGQPRELSSSTEPATGETVAWFETQEVHEQRPLAVAVGFKNGAAGLRIGWCTLAGHVQPWSYNDGLLQSLADYPWMRNGTPSPARALIDASYFRRYWHPPIAFQTLPDARFTCAMSTVCCKHDYEITLPAEAQQLIDAMPWQAIEPALSGTRLPVRADGKLQLKTVNERCRFLGSNRMCLIHQTLGRQPFGPCSVFPFSFAQTPDGVSVAMSPICGSTRRSVGVSLLDREDDLRERLVQSEARRTDIYRLAPDLQIPWENFRDIEQALCACLAAEGLPLRRRLHVGARLLSSLRDGEPLNMNNWLAEPPVAISAELREAIRGMLARVIGWDRAALRTLPALVPDFSLLEVTDTPIVVRILQNTLFSKVYSYQYDLTTAYNFLIVLYLLTLVMQANAPAGVLSDVMWQELGSLGVHGLLKSLLHEGVPDGFRATFGTAEFGQWMLVV